MVKGAETVNWAVVAGGMTGGGWTGVLVPPPHEVIVEMASTAMAVRISVPQRLLRAPQSTNASTGGKVNGRVRNGAGARRDCAEEMIVTTIGAEVLEEVKFTDVGLTLQAVPSGFNVV
jgi:hypothetical protein